jgi:hypothetical protein
MSWVRVVFGINAYIHDISHLQRFHKSQQVDKKFACGFVPGIALWRGFKCDNVCTSGKSLDFLVRFLTAWKLVTVDEFMIISNTCSFILLCILLEIDEIFQAPFVNCLLDSAKFLYFLEER